MATPTKDPAKNRETVSALILHELDNVVCLLRDHTKDQNPMLTQGNVPPVTSDIALGHKVAIKEIPKNTPVIKCGAEIGLATKNIRAGDHVHVHNLSGFLERELSL